MDIIITDGNYIELGYLKSYSLDLEIGKYGISSNDYELTINADNIVDRFTYNGLFYIEGTEYGGIVDDIRVNTESKTITYLGRTFRGMLEKEFIQPPEGQAYLKLSGEANSCIQSLIGNRFNDLIAVDGVGESGIDISYNVRDLNLLEALEKALGKYNCKLNIMHQEDGKVHLSVAEINDLSDLIQYDDSYNVSMVVETRRKPYNHILALGKGELLERLRVNLYLQKDGTWGDGECYAGLDRKTYKYDDSNTEDAEELKERAIENVNEKNGTDSLDITFNADNCELFDIVGSKENITGISFKYPITKKILKIDNEKVALSYKVGE